MWLRLPKGLKRLILSGPIGPSRMKTTVKLCPYRTPIGSCVVGMSVKPVLESIDPFLDTDSAYAPVTSHLADVLDEAVQTSPTGRWRIKFYLEPPTEQVIVERYRAAALQVFEQIEYGEQVHIVCVEPDENEGDQESHS